MIGTDVTLAQQFLQQNEVVAIPTETVYGLAANALQPEAVLKIFQIKNRPAFDPLIVHTNSIGKIKTFVKEIPDVAIQLFEHFSPGALTILLPKKDIIPDITTSGLEKVGVRIPNHPLTLQLLSQLDFPLAAPSANPFGYVSPTTAQHVADQLGDKVPYILDGGACSVGIESTVISVEPDCIVVYRMGGITIEQLQSVSPLPIWVRPHSTSNPQAPGMLESHYSPRKTVKIFSNAHFYDKKNIGLVAFRQDYGFEHQIILSPSGSLEEAAANLFAALRATEKMPVTTILVELVEENGLGRAINDRLKRAAAKNNGVS